MGGKRSQVTKHQFSCLKFTLHRRTTAAVFNLKFNETGSSFYKAVVATPEKRKKTAVNQTTYTFPPFKNKIIWAAVARMHAKPTQLLTAASL